MTPWRGSTPSGADAEILALARRCLAAEKRHRPRDAGEVAAAMTTYFNGVQEKLKQAELAQVEAQAKAVEERKRRKLQAGLAAAILALVVFGGGGGVWYVQERQQQSARVCAPDWRGRGTPRSGRSQQPTTRPDGSPRWRR